MKFMKLKMLDHATLLQLNERSVQTGRCQQIPESLLAGHPQQRYPINLSLPHQHGPSQAVRLCVVLDPAGQTHWLDVAPNEFQAIPEVEVIFDVYEGIMCAGNPPSAP